MSVTDLQILLDDIKTLDENMCGIELISVEYLKLVLRLFHSTSVSFQLNIEDSSSDEEDEEEQHPPTSSVQDIESEFD